MAKKKKIKREDDGIVYSTNPNYAFADLLKGLKTEDESHENAVDAQVRIHLEKKGRGGKTVSIVRGIEHENKLESIAKGLKNYLGTGGSVKEGEIIIQGSDRQKILEYLKKEGFQPKLSGG